MTAILGNACPASSIGSGEEEAREEFIFGRIPDHQKASAAYTGSAKTCEKSLLHGTLISLSTDLLHMESVSPVTVLLDL